MSARRRRTGWRSGYGGEPGAQRGGVRGAAGHRRVRARPERRRQDHPLPRAHRRARPLAGSVEVAGRPGLRGADRAHPARLPGERARRGADGRAGSGPLVAAGRARADATAAAAALARVGLADRGAHALRRALRRPAPAGAIARALVAGRPGAAARRAARRGRSRQRGVDHGAVRELRAEGRTLLVSTHDVESARAVRSRALPEPAARWRSGRRPRRCGGRSSRHLRQRDRGARAATGSRCGRSPSSTTSTDGRCSTSCSTRGDRASTAARSPRWSCSALLRGAGVLGRELPAELPRRVAGPRPAARAGAGRARRRAAAAGRRRRRRGGRGARRPGRPRRADRRRHGHRRGGDRHVRPRRAAGAVARRPRAPRGAAVRRPARGERRRPRRRGGPGRAGRRRPVRAAPPAHGRGLRRRRRRGRRRARPRACGWRSCFCSPPRSPWPCRGSAACWCSRCWWRPRWRSGATRAAHARRCWRAARWRRVAGRGGHLRLAPPGHGRRRVGGAGAVRGRRARLAQAAFGAAPPRSRSEQRRAQRRSSPCSPAAPA